MSTKLKSMSSLRTSAAIIDGKNPSDKVGGSSIPTFHVLGQLSSERRCLNAAPSINDKAPLYHIQVNYRNFAQNKLTFTRAWKISGDT